jgi:hypothetical protein
MKETNVAFNHFHKIMPQSGIRDSVVMLPGEAKVTNPLSTLYLESQPAIWFCLFVYFVVVVSK